MLKIDNDLERIADLAVNIAEEALAVGPEDLPIPESLGTMADRALVGELPIRWESASLACASAIRRSWRLRGTWTAQLVSRKNRLISPVMYGMATGFGTA